MTYNHDCVFFFLYAAATPGLYTLSLHDALPIWPLPETLMWPGVVVVFDELAEDMFKVPASSSNTTTTDRKSTRLNSSHVKISYAVFCLKKKKNERSL